MNRIDQTFSRLRAAGKKALITFVSAGCPDLATTEALVYAMEREGADLIELGIPFSDPIAEGPVIQEANVRALAGGVTVRAIFDAVKEIRRHTQVPLVFLLYYNTIFHMGPERFFAACADAGVDGVIVPDLPFEECAEIASLTEQYGVYQISMVAPTSTPDRMANICAQAKGFLYCVSSLGVTGMRSEFHTDFDAMFAALNRCSDVPKCLGFGISSPEQIRQLKGYGDGLIVGSAIVRQVLSAPSPQEAVEHVAQLTRSLKEAF